ncbi:MAG TPA: zinc-binding dehydrogenase [Sporichthyaceae bacterium]|jgi:S-(hydroxymethyl)glutathione dehydrogenase/alcohol dehydrogenase
MKAAVFTGVNQPVSIEDVTPIDPGPHDVVVRIGASGVCHSDLSIVDGTLGFSPPVIIGHEGAGTVEAVGSAVSRVKVGDRVIASFVTTCGECWYCKNNQPFVCAQTYAAHGAPHAHRAGGDALTCVGGLGTMAEFMTVNERVLVPVQSDLPMEQLALIGCGVTTGAGAALHTANVQPGSTVAVVGCGGVGQSVIQGARIAGAARIIAIDPVELKRATAGALGATDLIDPNAGDPIAMVRELTEGRGADYAFEVVGRPQTIATTIELTRPAGTAVVVGAMGPQDFFQVHGLSFIYGAKHIVASFCGSAVPDRDFPRFVELAEQGKLDLASMITRRYSLDQVNEALDATAKGDVLRAVLV